MEWILVAQSRDQWRGAVMGQIYCVRNMRSFWVLKRVTDLTSTVIRRVNKYCKTVNCCWFCTLNKRAYIKNTFCSDISDDHSKVCRSNWMTIRHEFSLFPCRLMPYIARSYSLPHVYLFSLFIASLKGIIVVNSAGRKTSETNGLSERKVFLLNKSSLQKKENESAPKQHTSLLKTNCHGHRNWNNHYNARFVLQYAFQFWIFNTFFAESQNIRR